MSFVSHPLLLFRFRFLWHPHSPRPSGSGFLIRPQFAPGPLVSSSFPNSGIPLRQDSGPAPLPEGATCGHGCAWWAPLGSSCLNPRSLVGTALRAIPLILLTPAARVVPCLFSKLPSSGPAARRPVISAPTWWPCGSCPDPRLAAPGFRESPSVPCIESVGMRSRFGWARGSTGLTEGSVCFWCSFQLGKLSVSAAPTPPSDCSWAPAVSSFLTQIRLWSGWLR
jgi:hypothetical protein